MRYSFKCPGHPFLNFLGIIRPWKGSRRVTKGTEKSNSCLSCDDV